MKRLKDLLLIIVLTFFNSLIVFYNYLSIPKNLAFDEFDFGKVALSLQNQPYTVYSSLATGHNTLYFYIILFSLKLFGITNFGLRLPAAIFGIMTVSVFFLIMKQIFKKSFLAFLLTAIFVTLRWYFNFERFAFEATFLLFLELVSLLFLLKFREKKRDYYLIISAIFAGLAFHSYYLGKVFFLIPLLFIFLKSSKRELTIFFVTFLIIVSPLLWYYKNHSDLRIKQVSLLSDQKLSPVQKVQGLGDNLKKTILMFHIKGDMNGRHNYTGKSALNPILGIFFLAGLILAVKNWPEEKNLLFITFFFLSLIPTILTHSSDNPSMLRTVTAIPSVIYFVGVATQFLLQKMHVMKKAGIVIVILIFLISSLYELRTYFHFQSRVMRNSFELTCSLPQVIIYKDLPSIPTKCRVHKNMF